MEPQGVDRGYPNYMSYNNMQGVPMNQARPGNPPLQRSQNVSMTNLNMQDSSHFVHPGPQNMQRGYSQGMPMNNGNVLHRAVSDSAIGSYDSSNFPSLSSSSNAGPSSNMRFMTPGQYNGSQPSNASNSQLLSMQTQAQDDFVLQNEDFPALSKITSSKNDIGMLGSSTSEKLDKPMVDSSVASGISPASTSGGSGGSGVGGGIGGGGATAQHLLASIEVIPVNLVTPGSQNKPDAKSATKYGLLGLLDVIKMTDKDLNSLVIGTDLTTLGLNLSSAECLFQSFSSPFSDTPLSSSEPQYTLPSCYLMNPPSLKADHVSKFQLESLFYMFYTMPKDVMQVVAALELYRREWKYHGELKIWLRPRSQQDLAQSHPTVPFVYFDVNDWAPKLFTMPFRGNLVSGLLSEEDIRVKPGATGPAPPGNSNINNNNSNSNPNPATGGSM